MVTPEKMRSWWQRHPTLAPCATLALITIVSMLPFLNKAVHLDDTLYLLTTRQILVHNPRPLDAMVNWYGWPMRLAEVNKNPPGISYLLAPVVAIGGWSEPAMHAMLLLLAVGAVLGTFFVARGLCGRPMLATLLTLFSPAFFVSATTLMSDVTMLCLWVWAVALWTRPWYDDAPAEPLVGEPLRLNGSLALPLRYLAAGACIALAVLFKYFAISLVPLLAIAGLTRKNLLIQLIALVIPLLVLGCFESVTARHYGHGLVRSAIGYSGEVQQDRATLFHLQMLAGFCFLGGCCIGAAVIVAMGLARRTVAIAIILAVLLLIALFSWARLIPLSALAEPNRTLITWHVLIFGLAGIGLLAATMADLYRHHNRASLLLALWVFGVFVFATVVNWSANARSILPLVPAVGIVAVRALDGSRPRAFLNRWLTLPVVVSAILSILVAFADMQFANASRTAAEMIFTRARTFHGTIWFEGHWGFQWYMERRGAAAIDYDNSLLPAGDLFVVPLDNTNLQNMPAEALQQIDDIKIPVMPFVATINRDCAAEFYSSIWGPLPFAIGPKAPEEFLIFRIRQNILPPKR